jgi:hypothetical protein
MITKAPEVHAFQSGEAGLFANAYLVETANHLVAVDSTLLESTSKALRQKVVELGKPLHAVLPRRRSNGPAYSAPIGPGREHFPRWS